MLLSARPAPIAGEVHRHAQEAVQRMPGHGRDAEGDDGEQRHRDQAERHVLPGEVGAQRAAAGQRHRLEAEGGAGDPDRVGVEDADERGPRSPRCRSIATEVRAGSRGC